MVEQTILEQLGELDGHLKRQAQAQMDWGYSQRGEVRDRAFARAGELIEQARGVRMAMDLVDGGKLIGGIVVPGSTLREVAAAMNDAVLGPGPGRIVGLRGTLVVDEARRAR